MPAYVALLRAVNVGGTGKLPMTELKAMCAAEDFAKVKTYIASGNVVFSTKQSASRVKAALEKRLHAYAGKPVSVLIRTAEEIAAVLKANPFPRAAPNRTMAIFVDEPLPPNALNDIRGRESEELRLGKREVYVYYPDGQGTSKLKIPAARNGTARNINTIAKLAELSAAL
jgi:uncharacterized protein (DUF1697 family)